MKYVVAAVVIALAASCEASQISDEGRSVAAPEKSDVLGTDNVDTVPDFKFLVDYMTHSPLEEDDLEARKKKEKKYLIHVLAAAFLIKGAVLPIAIAFLKLLTGKALLITVMALMLISVISLKTISRGGHHHHPQVINLVPHGRDIGSQELAYRSWLDDHL